MNIIRPISKQPIPEHAERVFKGVVFDVYQWEQEMFDGSKKTFEKLTRPDTVVVFPVLDDGRILIAKEEQPGKVPFLGALGGRSDEGEDPLSAIKRELLEESGYEAKEFILADARHASSKIDWVIYTFIAKGLRKVAEMDLDGGEKINLMTVTFDELIDIITDENKDFGDKEMLAKFYDAKYDLKKKEELRDLFKPLKNYF